jgi:hypothetical protein
MFQKLRVALPVLLLAGCGGSPSSFSSTPSTPVAPTATVSSIAVSGNSPAVGETSQFTATATLPTGTTQDVTAQATWQSSDAAVATVSSAGVVRSMAAGEADITATYSGVRGSQHVRVAAAVVTRTLAGIITDDSNGRPIVDQAEAQIMDGENAGKAGRVDANGHYSIPDVVAGTFMLRARATGYESRDHQVTMDAPDVRVDFALRAASCSYVVTTRFDPLWPDSYLQVPSTGGGPFTADVRLVTGDCSWQAEARQLRPCNTCLGGEQIQLIGPASGRGSGAVTFNVLPFQPGGPVFPQGRELDVTWNGGEARIHIEQRICSYTPPASVSFDATGGSSSHQVIWDTVCQYKVSSDASWINVTKTELGFLLNAPPNSQTTSRTATITVTAPFGVRRQTAVVQAAAPR